MIIQNLQDSFDYVINLFGQPGVITSSADSSTVDVTLAFRGAMQSTNLEEQVDFEERKVVIKADDLGDFVIKNGDRLDVQDNEFHIIDFKKEYIGAKLVGYTLTVVE